MATCCCMTKSGSRCTKPVSTKPNSNPKFCWQHQSCTNENNLCINGKKQPIKGEIGEKGKHENEEHLRLKNQFNQRFDQFNRDVENLEEQLDELDQIEEKIEKEYNLSHDRPKYDAEMSKLLEKQKESTKEGERLKREKFKLYGEKAKINAIKTSIMIENNPLYIQQLAEEHKIYYNNLDDELKKAVIAYTGNEFTAMNKYLRGQLTGTKSEIEIIKKYVKDLNIVLEDAPPIAQPIIVYRGIMLQTLPASLRQKLSDLKVGDTLDLFRLGFNSTTFNLNVAEDFTLGECCIYMLYLPPGVKGLYIGKQSNMPGEDEFILGSGPSFRVFKFEGEDFPIKYGNKKVYRLACNDCKEIYHIDQSFKTELICRDKTGCYRSSSK